MIEYTPNNQLSIESFETPFELTLDPSNRWVKLSDSIPWDSLVSIYVKGMNQKMGRGAINPRVVIGALIIKHKLGLSDRETILMIQENMYMQYFIGYSSFSMDPAFDASLFVTIRKRIGNDKFDLMNQQIISKAEGIVPPTDADDESQDIGKGDPTGSSQSKGKSDSKAKLITHKGFLKLDATVADQMIEYPTDLKLLHTARLETERIIDILYKQSDRLIKPRTYRRVAQTKYLKIARQKNKPKALIRKGIRQQLGYVFRNLNTIEEFLDQLPQLPLPLENRDFKLYRVIQQVYEQQKYMYDNRVKSVDSRIVSIYQPYVRPIPRGKDKGKTEFGAKLGVSECNGFARINKLSWDAYNECNDLIGQVEAYRSLYGYYPEVVLVDKIYLTRSNRAWLKQHGISHRGKPLGRTKPLSAYFKRKYKKQRNMRNHVEGKFGQGKNAYGLSKIRSTRQDTSESWIAAIFFVMNITRLGKITPAIFWLVTSPIFWWILFFCPNLNQNKIAINEHRAVNPALEPIKG